MVRASHIDGVALRAASIETLDKVNGEGAAVTGSVSLKSQSSVTKEGATGMTSSSDSPKSSCVVKRAVDKVLRLLILNQD